MKKIKSFLLILLLLTAIMQGFAQPVEQNVKVIVAPDHTDWQYKTGEKVIFQLLTKKREKHHSFFLRE